jgi:hypothetical protein
MSKPEYRICVKTEWKAPVNPAKDPGGAPGTVATSQTFPDWVRRDREWKENGAISLPKYS